MKNDAVSFDCGIGKLVTVPFGEFTPISAIKWLERFVGFWGVVVVIFISYTTVPPLAMVTDPVEIILVDPTIFGLSFTILSRTTPPRAEEELVP